MTPKLIPYKKEAIEETVSYCKKDDYRQQQANENLAKILEIVRAKVSPSNKDKQSDYAFVQQVTRIFPE